VAERYLARLGVTLTPAMELGSTEAIREALAAGLGVALVSRHAVLARDRRIVAARLAGPRWTRDLLIVRRLGTPLGPAAAALRSVLLEARAWPTQCGSAVREGRREGAEPRAEQRVSRTHRLLGAQRLPHG